MKLISGMNYKKHIMLSLQCVYCLSVHTSLLNWKRISKLCGHAYLLDIFDKRPCSIRHIVGIHINQCRLREIIFMYCQIDMLWKLVIDYIFLLTLFCVLPRMHNSEMIEKCVFCICIFYDNLIFFSHRTKFQRVE